MSLDSLSPMSTNKVHVAEWKFVHHVAFIDIFGLQSGPYSMDGFTIVLLAHSQESCTLVDETNKGHTFHR